MAWEAIGAAGTATQPDNGGPLEHTWALAARESFPATRLYDHLGDRLCLDESERIRI